MSDIFREVEEEVRRERYAALWKKYGDFILAGIALLLLAIAGYQVWRYYEHRAREQASQEFAAAQALLQSNRPNQAATAFAKLADSAPDGYAMVARLANADALEAAGEQSEAIMLYKRIAASNDALLGAIARLHEGWALAGSVPRLQIETLLAPLTDPNSQWRFMAREILAYADYRARKFDAAQKAYAALAAEQDAPIGVRQRANAMATFLKAGGDQEFGTVPPPAPAAKPGAQQPKPKTSEKGQAKK